MNLLKMVAFGGLLFLNGPVTSCSLLSVKDSVDLQANPRTGFIESPDSPQPCSYFFLIKTTWGSDAAASEWTRSFRWTREISGHLTRPLNPMRLKRSIASSCAGPPLTSRAPSSDRRPHGGRGKVMAVASGGTFPVSHATAQWDMYPQTHR